MKIVKNHCRNCGYSEQYTKKELRIRYITGFIRELFFVLGIIFIALIIFVGPSTMLDTLSSSIMVKYAVNDMGKDELRNLAIDWTNASCSDDSMCYAEKIYEHTKNIPYIPANKFNPIESNVLKNFNGTDCKGMSILYTSLMKSVGQNAQVICSIKYEHCVSKVIIDKNKYLIIDLTGPMAISMNNTQKEWTYFLEGEEIWK